MQPGLISCSPEHERMPLHQWRHGVISTSDHGGHGNAAAQAGIQHQMIPLQKTDVRQGQAPQSIIPMRINTCVVEHHLRLQPVEQIR